MNPKVILILILMTMPIFLFTAFWQLEIVYIVASNPLPWGFNFAGFGDFGLPLWAWRDIAYFVIAGAFFIFGIAAFLLGREVELS